MFRQGNINILVNFNYDYNLIFLSLDQEREHFILNMTTSCETDYIKCNSSFVGSKVSLFLESKSVLKNIEFNYLLYIRSLSSRNTEEFNNMLNLTLNLCEFLSAPHTEALLGIIFKQVLSNKNSKVFNKCPIKPASFNLNRINNSKIINSHY